MAFSQLESFARPQTEEGSFKSNSSTQPPAIGGWNAKDPLENMEPTDAVKLVNIFPGTDSVSIRKGFSSHATGLGGSVQSLMEYSSEAGTRKLLAGANGNIWDATSAGAATSKASGFSINKWQYVNFAQKMIMVNGTDQPQQYDGTTVSAAAYTGIADDATLANVSVYRQRLYFVEKNTAHIWYGGVTAVTGALTLFDVEDVLLRGGNLLYAGSMAREHAGAAMEDYFVIISNMGEILIYAGLNPGDVTWGLVGHFYIPIPLGSYKCAVQFGGDLAIITQEGVIPVSTLLSPQARIGNYTMITDRIRNEFRRAGRNYKSNFGWQIVFYPQADMAVVNIPVSDDSNYVQYVMNTLTGAWCKFTGMDGPSWGLLNEHLYFGDTTGIVYKADDTFADNSNAIEVEMRTAFNYFGDRTRKKHFKMVRPIFVGDTAIEFILNMDTDFDEDPLTGSIQVSGSPGEDWDVATWDTASWDVSDVYHTEWYSVTGLGRCGSISLKGSIKNAPFTMSSFQVIYEPGGIF
jgi:hypothetical protein